MMTIAYCALMLSGDTQAKPASSAGDIRCLFVLVRVNSRRLRLMQSQLAAKVGDTNKAVVHQWETRKANTITSLLERVQRLSRF
jgi:hypothetical protein